MLFILILNGFAGVTVSVIYTYVSTLVAKQSIQDEQIEYLCQKICQLEKKINELQASKKLEDQMKDDLQTKLEEFINTQYEVVE